MKTVYLDYAATTPVRPEVLEAMLPYFAEIFGNPSSAHGCGQDSRLAVEKARASVAGLIGANADEIVFTSGGSEADNHALIGIAQSQRTKGNHIITSTIEHHAISETCTFLKNQGFEITSVPVDADGVIDPQAVKDAITGRTVLASIMLANNEVGTIQPLREIGEITRQAGIYLHTDAVQATGHIPVDVDEIKVDLLSISAHKLYGPKGTGALYIRRGTKIGPYLHGGAQEDGRRAGTENVAGIVGFGKAAGLARDELIPEMMRLTAERDRMIRAITTRIPKVTINGHPTRRLPNNVNISVEGAAGEALLLNLDLEGFCASTGSACNTSSHEPSHVLLALGMPPEQAHSSLRMTLGRWTTAEEVDRCVDALVDISFKLRRGAPLRSREPRS